jgi:uncharacterized protein YjbJ (UPF0337 family)
MTGKPFLETLRMQPRGLAEFQGRGSGRRASADRAEASSRSATCSRSFIAHEKRRNQMDKEHVKGVAEKAKGAVKEGAGKVSGDKKLQSEGKTDKAKGSIHDAAGDVKDAARDATDD